MIIYRLGNFYSAVYSWNAIQKVFITGDKLITTSNMMTQVQINYALLAKKMDIKRTKKMDMKRLKSERYLSLIRFLIDNNYLFLLIQWMEDAKSENPKAFS